MQNVEIKAAVRDPAALRRAVEAMDAPRAWERLQRDTFFRVPRGYLKLRQVEGEPAELIAYAREAGSEPRPSDYDIAVVDDGEALLRALARSLGVRGVVEKRRRLHLWRHTRIHLDTVTGLGEFMELETVVDGITMEEARREAAEAIERLGLDPVDFLDRPYLELLEARGS